MRMSLTREEFSRSLGRLLRETYPTMTDETVRKEMDQQLDSGSVSRTIIGLFVRDNLKKVEVE